MDQVHLIQSNSLWLNIHCACCTDHETEEEHAVCLTDFQDQNWDALQPSPQYWAAIAGPYLDTCKNCYWEGFSSIIREVVQATDSGRESLGQGSCQIRQSPSGQCQGPCCCQAKVAAELKSAVTLAILMSPRSPSLSPWMSSFCFPFHKHLFFCSTVAVGNNGTFLFEVLNSCTWRAVHSDKTTLEPV